MRGDCSVAVPMGRDRVEMEAEGRISHPTVRRNTGVQGERHICAPFPSVHLHTTSDNSHKGIAILHLVAFSNAVMAPGQPLSFPGTFCSRR